MMNNDLISRSALIEYFERLALALANAECYAAADVTQTAAETLRLAPSIDAEPVRHGRWTFFKSIAGDEYTFECSICNEWTNRRHNFCPNCGAKMDVEVERWLK